MLNHFCKTPLWEASRTLVDVAQGRKSADTVIKGAILVNVCTHEYIIILMLLLQWEELQWLVIVLTV